LEIRAEPDITRFKNILNIYFLDSHLTYSASLSILAQLLGFIDFFLNFFNAASMFLSVIGAIQISDDADDVKTP